MPDNLTEDQRAICDLALERIAQGTHTKADLDTLRRCLSFDPNSGMAQVGKYNVHIGQGQDIQIGNRIYQGADAEAIRAIIREVLAERHTLPLAEQARLLAAYRRRVLQETRYVQLAGIPLPRDRDGQPIPLQVPLDRVYIRIQAMPEAQGRETRQAERRAMEEELHRERDEGMPPSAPDPLSVLRRLGEYFYRRGEVYRAEARPQPVDPEAALQKHGRLVVLGAPGAGKTTLLRYLARRAAEDDDSLLPVRVSLRDYAAYRGTGGQESLRVFALRHAAGGDERLQQVLEQATAEGHVLWLVDALDEARGWRSDAAREAAALPGQMVLTSRPVGYERAGLEGLPHFEALALTPEERAKFLRDWFSVLAEARGADETWVERRVAWLQAQLETRPRIQPLTRNPLLLTFLVVLAGEEPARELPASRAELYRQYVEELLTTWEYRRRPKEGVAGEPSLHLGTLTSGRARQAALQGLLRLGWRLHLTYYGGQVQEQEMPERKSLVAYLAQEFTEPHWGLNGAKAKATAEAVLDFWEEAGLLTHWRLEGRDYLAFRHLTFQEYAAARTLADLWEREQKRAWRFLRPRLHHYAWREVVLLLAGILKDATPLVRRIRRARSPYEWELRRDLHLAAEVVGEGARVDEHEGQRLARKLGSLIAPWRRRAGTGILVLIFLAGLLLPWWEINWYGALAANLVWVVIWYALISETPPPWVRAFLWLPTRLVGQGLGLEEHVKSLRTIGNLGVKPLIRALGDEDWNVREAAAQALGELGDARAVEPLIRALGDEDWNVSKTSETALVKLRDTQAVKLLICALGDKSWRGYEFAVWVLGELGDRRAVNPLIGILIDEDMDVDVRETTVWALGKLGDRRAVNPLIGILIDEDMDVDIRETAVWALGKLGDKRAMNPLIRILEGEDADMRRVAAQALGELGDRRAVTPLTRIAIADKVLRVRWAAQRALDQLKDNQMIDDKIPHMHGIARWALGELTSKQEVDSLIRALEGKEKRRRAAEALGTLGDARATKPLIRALGGEDDDVREAAAQALGKLGDARAVEPLIRALGDKWGSVRRAAAQALEKLGDGIPTSRLARRAARALWWRLTDVWSVARAAYDALRQVVARLTELEVAALPFADPLFPSPSQGKQWVRYGTFAGGLVLLWVVDLVTNVTANLLSEWLGTLIPRGGLGWLALVVAVGLGASWLATHRPSTDAERR